MSKLLIEWDDASFSTGIKLIDQQHKQLVNYINMLAAAITNNNTEDIIQDLFQKLYDYTLYHFKAEEEYFHSLNSNDMALHALQHKHFIEELDRIKQQSTLQVSYNLLFFLTDWIIDHIVIEDKKFIQAATQSSATSSFSKHTVS